MSGPSRKGPHPNPKRARAKVELVHDFPARPANPRWRHLDACEKVTALVGAPSHVYQFAGLRVISSAIHADYHGEFVPQNHLTVSVREMGRRVTDAEFAIVRADFDLEDVEEDNHSPGRIRNLFLPLNLPRGTVGICECKTDETVVVEPDGHVWSKVTK